MHPPSAVLRAVTFSRPEPHRPEPDTMSHADPDLGDMLVCRDRRGPSVVERQSEGKHSLDASVLACSDRRGPSVVERQSEFDSERDSRPTHSTANACHMHAGVLLSLVAALSLLGGGAAGGATGYYVGRTEIEVRCGSGTVLSSAGDECIVQES